MTPIAGAVARPKPRFEGVAWSEREGHAMRVSAVCWCGRGLYFRYGVSAARELVVEDTNLGGPAVLRCIGCGEMSARCFCVPD